MSKQEILVTTTGEMTDMLACMAVYSGDKRVKRKYSMEKILFDMR